MKALVYGLLAFVAAAPLLTSPRPTLAYTTHVTSGTGGAHNPSHSLNPGHLWALVKAPTSSADDAPGPPYGTGGVSSGGRYHDQCAGADYVCAGAVPVAMGDFAMDIAADGDFGDAGTKAYIYVDFAGYGTANNPTPPDLSKDITITAIVLPGGDVCGDGSGQYRKYEIHMAYTDINGAAVNASVGWVAYMHVTNWNPAYPVGYTITPTGHRSTGVGSGMIHYLNGSRLGDIHPGATGNCNTGSHLHLEFYSYHSYGRDYEWHGGDGPDGYLEPNPDHKHVSGVAVPVLVPQLGAYADRRDETTKGTTFVGLIGGDSTLFRMSDNPYESDH